MVATYEDPSSWTFETEGGIKYRLVSTTGEATQATTRMSEDILIASTDLDAFINESFPEPEIINNIPVFNNRSFPGLDNLKTDRILIKGHLDSLPIDPYSTDPTAPARTYQNVLILGIDYLYDVEQDPNNPETFMEISANASIQVAYRDGNKAKFASAGGDESQNRDAVLPAAQLIPQTQYTVTRSQIPRDWFRRTYIRRLRGALGRVNFETVPLLYDAPAQTLLFNGWSMRQEFRRPSAAEVGPIDFKMPLTVELIFLEKFVREPNSSDGSLTYENTYDDEDGNEITETVGYHAWNEEWNPGVGWETFFYDGISPLYNVYNHNWLLMDTSSPIGEKMS